MFQGSRIQLKHKADNSTVICEPLFTQFEILNISQPYRPPRPNKGMALLIFMHIINLTL
jgi:hypothetical protein